MEFVWMDPHEIVGNPSNPRRHPQLQRHALHRALESAGWIKPLIWNRRSGQLIDGHLRREEAIEEGLTQVPVMVVDLDERQENVALASLDSITSMATLDEAMFRELLSDVQAEDAGLAELLASADDQEFRLPEEDAPFRNDDPMRVQLVPGEKFDYVMLLFRTELDWLRAVEHFNLERREDPFIRCKEIGQVRVVEGADYLARMDERGDKDG
jgi:hypothetical protein